MELYKIGYTQRAIGQEVGCSVGFVNKIVNKVLRGVVATQANSLKTIEPVNNIQDLSRKAVQILESSTDDRVKLEAMRFMVRDIGTSRMAQNSMQNGPSGHEELYGRYYYSYPDLSKIDPRNVDQRIVGVTRELVSELGGSSYCHIKR
jgi:hypothetical protein